jgi:hypothetical protein
MNEHIKRCHHVAQSIKNAHLANLSFTMLKQMLYTDQVFPIVPNITTPFSQADDKML